MLNASNFVLQIALKPTLLYENSYEAIPGYIAKEPTVSQVPTHITGAVDITVFNSGNEVIKVTSSFTKGHSLGL